jgi:organic radical activating enzyme
MEHFYTLQGEGAWTGTAAYFIRLGGCDVGCFWCDVKESWPEEAHPRLTVGQLVEAVEATSAPCVVITGGEPTMHDLSALTTALHAAGRRVHIETSGVHPLTGAIDWVCFSPKKFKAPVEGFHQLAHELKVVVHNRQDLAWAEAHAAECPASTQLFLQPQWYRPESMQWIVAYVQQHPRWRISLQTHKYLEIP